MHSDVSFGRHRLASLGVAALGACSSALFGAPDAAGLDRIRRLNT